MARKQEPELNGIARLFQQRKDAESGQQPDDETFRVRYPTLFSMMANNRISEKQWTDPARLTVSNDNGEWSLTLAVPGLGAYTTVLAPTIEQGFGELEARLAGGLNVWKFNLKRSTHVRKFSKTENQD